MWNPRLEMVTDNFFSFGNFRIIIGEFRGFWKWTVVLTCDLPCVSSRLLKSVYKSINYSLS